MVSLMMGVEEGHKMREMAGTESSWSKQHFDTKHDLPNQHGGGDIHEK